MSNNDDNNAGSNDTGAPSQGAPSQGAPSQGARSQGGARRWTATENQTLRDIIQALGDQHRNWHDIANTMNTTFGTDRSANSMRAHYADITISIPNLQRAPGSKKAPLTDADLALVARDRAQNRSWPDIVADHFADRGITRSGIAKSFSRWQAQGGNAGAEGQTSEASTNIVQPPGNAAQSSLQALGPVPTAPALLQVPNSSSTAPPGFTGASAPTRAPIPTLTLTPTTPMPSSLVPVTSPTTVAPTQPTAPSSVRPVGALTMAQLDWIKYMRESGYTWADIAGSPDLTARGYTAEAVREEFTMWVHFMIREATGMLNLTTADVSAVPASTIQELDELFADPDMEALLSSTGPAPVESSSQVPQIQAPQAQQPAVQTTAQTADPRETQAETQEASQSTSTQDPASYVHSQDDLEGLFGGDEHFALSDDQLRSFLDTTAVDETWGETGPGAFDQGDLYGSD